MAIELRAPVGDTFDLIERVRVTHAEAKVLVCSALPEPLVSHLCVRYGALGVLSKSATLETLVGVLQQLHEGSAPVCSVKLSRSPDAVAAPAA